MQAKKIFPAGFITSLLCLAVAASAASVDDCASEVVGNMGNLIDNFVNQLPLDYGVTVWGPQDNRNSENCFEKNPFEMALESLRSLLSQLHNGSNVRLSGDRLLKPLKDICHSNETVCLCRARVKPDSLATALKRLTKDVGKSEGASSKCLSSPATTKDTESTASPVTASAANTDATSRLVVPPASSAPAAAENTTADATSRPAVSVSPASDHCANGESRAGMSAESPSGVDTWRISACVFMGTTGVLLVYLVVRNENNAPNGGGAPEGRAAATARGFNGQGTTDDVPHDVAKTGGARQPAKGSGAERCPAKGSVTPADAGWHCERRRRSLATHWSMRNCHVPLQHAELQTLMELRSATGMEADNQSDDPGTVDNLV